MRLQSILIVSLGLIFFALFLALSEIEVAHGMTTPRSPVGISEYGRQ